jgi:hypothetical protein
LPRWWFVGAWRSSRYGALFLMKFNPMDVAHPWNAPRGSLNGGGDQSRACDAGRLAPTFSDVEDELQRSATNEIRLRRGGVTRRRVTWCWLSMAGSPTERG